MNNFPRDKLFLEKHVNFDLTHRHIRGLHRTGINWETNSFENVSFIIKDCSTASEMKRKYARSVLSIVRSRNNAYCSHSHLDDDSSEMPVHGNGMPLLPEVVLYVTPG